MRIGIIGAGNIGTGLGRRLAAAGHEILVSFARSAEKVAAAATAIGGGARAGDPAAAARHGEVLILATPWGVTLDAIRPLRDAFAGKIVWDTTNPYAPSMDELLLGTSTSAGEQVQAALPDARVVKAVPPFAELLHAASMLIDGRRPGALVCGDDEAARSAVAGLLTDAGVDAVAAGPLKLARFTEPAGMLVTNLAYVQGLGARTGLTLLRETPASTRTE